MSGRTRLLDAEAAALLDHEIDDLLLDLRGFALVRTVLETRGASRDEIEAHNRALERVRAQLVERIGGATSAAA